MLVRGNSTQRGGREAQQAGLRNPLSLTSPFQPGVDKSFPTASALTFMTVDGDCSRTNGKCPGLVQPDSLALCGPQQEGELCTLCHQALSK